MVKWYRISVILKALEIATKQTTNLQGATDDRPNERFTTLCRELTKTNCDEHFIIDVQTLNNAWILTEFFFKTHLLLCGYNINFHTHFTSIINNLLVA